LGHQLVLQSAATPTAERKRLVLVLPTATYRASAFIEAATALRVDLVVASERRQTMAAHMDGRALVVDLTCPDSAAARIVELAGRLPLDAVVAVDDAGVAIAAEASERLGLAHNRPAAVARTRDKLAMRRALAGAAVAQPAFHAVSVTDDPGELAVQIGLPCVVKPLTLSGSTGVIRVDTAPEARAAGRRVRAILDAHGHDPTAELVIERFIAGAEVAVEGILRDGRLEILALFDKPDPLDGPFFEETIYVTPSRHTAFEQQAITDTLQGACQAIGLTEGPVHGEVRVGAAGDIWVLEVAARSIGGLCSRALRFGVGISLEEVILRHAVGLPVDDLRRRDAASGVMMLPIPRSGIFEHLGGTAEARSVPGIVGLEVTVPRGRFVQSLPEGDRYLGFLFARGDTPAGVELALRQAHAALRVTIADRG
jgi:biotin carboxylase